jgi:hypothetical protein
LSILVAIETYQASKLIEWCAADGMWGAQMRPPQP